MPDWKSLIHELHRRSLWQVLGIYLAGAWGALEFIEFVTRVVGLPQWVTPGALVLFAAGLPIVLATAFVQEGHPMRGRISNDPTLLPELQDPMYTMVAAPQTATPRRLRRWLTWRRALLGGAVAFAGLGATTGGYMGMRGLGIGPAGTLLAAGVLTSNDRVVLADLDAADAELGMANVITEALRIDLLQSTAFSLVDPAEIQQVLARMQRESGVRLSAEAAREVARREGYELVLAGNVGRLGEGYVLTARLLVAETGATAAAFRQTAAGDADLLATVDALSRGIRARIGESLRSVNASEPLERVTTSSFAALVRYSTAERIVTGREPADGRSPWALMSEAVELDSTFAMAHRRLGAWLYNARAYTEGIAALRAAYRHRERLPELERRLAEGLYYARVVGDDFRAAQAHRRVLELDPNQKTALNNITLDYIRMGRFEEAVGAGMRGVAQPYPYNLQFGNLAATLIRLGRWDDALAIADSASKLFPDDHRSRRNRTAIAVNRRELERADSLATDMVEWAKRISPVRFEALHTRASIRATQGRLRDAGADLRQILSWDIPVRQVLLETTVRQARLEAELRGDRHAAVALVRRGLDSYPVDSMPSLDAPILEVAEIFAIAGDVAEAERWLARADARRPEEAVRKEVLYEHTRARLLLHAGRAPEAISLLRRLSQERSCPRCVAVLSGEAFERLGAPDSAIAHYRLFIDTPQWNRIDDDALYLAPTHFRLAALLEQRGDTAGAAQHYAAFMNLWRNADPELQPRVRAAQQRLAALGGPR